ncbi:MULTISPECIES: hypothetical protein [unclassified Actinomyces]|uniref:hypothetical protein n=1 Tax=unclassified Actinomyces TaxID=2609248 RepID=UPI0011BFE15D|nr:MULTISPECIES: hypothetical protein [unclassified Actinomyces]
MSQPQSPYGPNQQPAPQSQYGQAPYGQQQPGMSTPTPGAPMQQPQQPTRQKRRIPTIVIAVPLIIIIGVIIGVTSLNRPTPATKAATGECIQEPEGKKSSEVHVTDCDADDAAYKVTAAAGADCTTLAGTTTVYEDLCLIGVNEDPSISLAGVQEGDCLHINESTREATAQDCTTGSREVLKVLTDVKDSEMETWPDACYNAGVDDDAYDYWYVWNFDFYSSSTEPNLGSLTGDDTNDIVFCLGTEQP